MSGYLEERRVVSRAYCKARGISMDTPNPIPFAPATMQTRDLLSAAEDLRRFFDLAARDDLTPEQVLFALRETRTHWDRHMEARREAAARQQAGW